MVVDDTLVQRVSPMEPFPSCHFYRKQLQFEATDKQSFIFLCVPLRPQSTKQTVSVGGPPPRVWVLCPGALVQLSSHAC